MIKSIFSFVNAFVNSNNGVVQFCNSPGATGLLIVKFPLNCFEMC